MSLINVLIKALIRLGPQEDDRIAVSAGSGAFEMLRVLPQTTIHNEDSLSIEPITGYLLFVLREGPGNGMIEPFSIVLAKLPSSGAEQSRVDIFIIDHTVAPTDMTIEINVSGPKGSGKTVIAALIAKAVMVQGARSVQVNDIGASLLLSQPGAPVGPINRNIVIKTTET
jgi:hypothetical protein